MIPLTLDFMFKSVFEKHSNILKDFLISTLELNINADDTKLEILNNELVKENYNEYQKKVDIMVTLDKKNILILKLIEVILIK